MKCFALRWPVVLFVAVAALAAVCGELSAQEPPRRPRVVRIRVGFEGQYKVGCWTPVEITFRGGREPETGRVIIQTTDGDGSRCRFHTPDNRPVTFLPGQDRAVLLYAKFGRQDGELRVVFAADGKRNVVRDFDAMTADTELAVPMGMSTDQRLVVGVGPSIGVDAIVRSAEQEFHYPHRTEYVALDDAARLPTRWYGYESIDTLVLATSQPDVYTKLLDNSAQLAALRRWVEMGGKLLLCVGREAPRMLAEGQPLAPFAPGRFTGDLVPLSPTQLGAWETYAGVDTPLETRSTETGDARLRVPLLTDVTGRVEAPATRGAGDPPLVIRSAFGFGEVIFVAADLDRPPFVRWEKRRELVGKLLEIDVAVTQEQSDAAAQQLQYRYGEEVDLSGQLRGALEQFEDVTLVPFWVVALLVVAYIALIGPGDYFFLKKVWKRMEATWITFPAIVLCVSFGAYGAAYWLKGDQLRVNQVNVVDIDVESGLVRGTSWIDIFSPRMSTFDFTLQPRLPEGEVPADAEAVLSGFRLPALAMGSQFGGSSGAGIGGTYDFAPELDAMRGVPIQVWSTKSFAARWSAATLDAPRAELEEADDQIAQGVIQNTLDVALHDCLLVYDRWVYDIGTIAPGETVELGPQRREPPRMLFESFLLGERAVERRKGGEVVRQLHRTAWGRAGRGVADYARHMMFFEAAGGEAYHNALNGYQQFVDLSDHARLGKAILIASAETDMGRPQNHGPRLLDAGQPMDGPKDKYWTFYRFVYPVAAKTAPQP